MITPDSTEGHLATTTAIPLRMLSDGKEFAAPKRIYAGSIIVALPGTQLSLRPPLRQWVNLSTYLLPPTVEHPPEYCQLNEYSLVLPLI